MVNKYQGQPKIQQAMTGGASPLPKTGETVKNTASKADDCFGNVINHEEVPSPTPISSSIDREQIPHSHTHGPQGLDPNQAVQQVNLSPEKVTSKLTRGGSFVKTTVSQRPRPEGGLFRPVTPPHVRLGQSAAESSKLSGSKSLSALDALQKSSSIETPSSQNTADLKTKQGPQAEMNAFHVELGITSHISKLDEPVFEKLQDPTNSPKEQFLCTLDATEEMIDELDLTNESNCKFLNNMAVLMHKAFNKEKGGIGSVREGNWNSQWNDIGGKKGFKAGQTQQNDLLKAQYKEMLNFYKNNADNHFESKSVAGNELASIQIAATIGQLLHDFVCEGTYDNNTRMTLFNKLHDKGVVNTPLDKVREMDNKMRNNPLLAEVPNKKLIDELTKGIEGAEKQKECKAYFSQLLRESNPNATDDEIKNLTDKMFSSLVDQIRNIKTKSQKSGNRGRMPLQITKPEKPNLPTDLETKSVKERVAAMDKYNNDLIDYKDKMFDYEQRLEFAKTIAGSSGEKHSIAIQPDRKNDEIADDAILETFKDDPTVQELYQSYSPKGGNILQHEGSPTVLLRLGTGLAPEIKGVSQLGFLRETMSQMMTMDNVTDKEKEMLQNARTVITIPASYTGRGATPEEKAEDVENQKYAFLKNRQNYQHLFSGIEVTFNQPTEQKVTYDSFTEVPSVAGIMYNSDLRTICSISGTTVDVVVSSLSTMGEEKAKKLLQPLMDHVKDPNSGALETEDGKKFKEFYSSICFFMQAGQYHTAGEVLGGLFIASRALTVPEGKKEGSYQDIKVTYKQFEDLMGDFSAHPDHFINVRDEDKDKVNDPMLLAAFQSAISK